MQCGNTSNKKKADGFTRRLDIYKRRLIWGLCQDCALWRPCIMENNRDCLFCECSNFRCDWQIEGRGCQGI